MNARACASIAAAKVFRIAFARWIDDPGQREFPQLVRESLDALKAVTAGG